jgi:hypothetical protein
MGRTRANVLTAVVIAAFAVAGNALRAAAPRTVADVELRRVRAPQAGSFTERTLDADFLEVLRARDVLYRIYTAKNGEPVWVFLGYFDRQKEGSQVHSPRHCYPGSGWNIESEPRWAAPWGSGEVASLVVDELSTDVQNIRRATDGVHDSGSHRSTASVHTDRVVRTGASHGG